uniref:Uncharacterized protein n=1 Tax=Rhizophagus irregularis (strain DAOM 181602 / DAOM 197198 / MUCL 43194) TaxID=747089 RepID=U9UDN7_RHIID
METNEPAPTGTSTFSATSDQIRSDQIRFRLAYLKSESDQIESDRFDFTNNFSRIHNAGWN